ncbi:hypothetical protein TNIN_231251 [Trichonephila inaurata madagascariensis]|uniref:Uncharacterized protein n=1 Tax=Trichonephila inaurata madagascariensis TaxID=2747483 RepID=A0A8X6XUQ1_9ARAC|nr:hypothetical protein TNIN_231251 [Trichonephila inaurata madagascariensis]
MAEEERLKGLEEEWEKQMKKRMQEETKRGLDECVREKLKRKAKEVQDDLLEDLFFLKQIMETEEEVKKNEKKKALLKEQREYLRYLQEQMRQEAEFEKEVDKMYQEELDKAWERRRKEWQEEKNKRRQREQDVMQGIKEQIMANGSNQNEGTAVGERPEIEGPRVGAASTCPRSGRGQDSETAIRNPN